jgi:hypothetical protein
VLVLLAEVEQLLNRVEGTLRIRPSSFLTQEEMTTRD